MNKNINYLSVSMAVITVISIFLPWAEASSSFSFGNYSGSYHSGGVSGFYCGAGIIGLLIGVTGGILAFNSFKWTFVTGILNFLIGLGFVFGWFSSGGFISYNTGFGYGHASAHVNPQFGLYIFLISSFIFIITSMSYLTKKKSMIEEVIKDKSDIIKEPDEISILKELKAKDILTQEEFNNKMTLIEENKKNFVFDLKLKKETDPLIKPLKELQNKGLINEDEFNKKKCEIIENQKKLLIKFLENNPIQENDPDFVLSTLSLEEQEILNSKISLLKDNEIIIINGKSRIIKRIHKNEFQSNSNWIVIKKYEDL